MKIFAIFKNITFQIISIFVLLSVIYAPVLWGIYKKVSVDEDYTHAFLIPFIALYLIWERRRDLKSVRIQPYWPALFLLFFSFVFSLYGILGSDISAARISWWLWLVSIVLFCYGKEVFRILFVPLLILAFVVPLPQHVYAPITMSLKLLSSRLAYFLITLLGIPAFLDGNVIDLGTVKLQVIDACSGLRYVLSLIALSILCAYYFQRHWFKRLLLVLLSLPISVLMNGLRVAIIAVLYKWVGPKVAEGFFHEVSGLFVFIFAFLLLMFCSYLLKFLPPEETKVNISIQHDAISVARVQERIDNSSAYFIAFSFLVILFLSTFFVSSLPRHELVHGFENFPLRIDGWEGVAEPVDPEILKRSGAEIAFQATYFNANNDLVTLYIGYRSTPFLETEEFFHSPTVCLPASGWKILEKSTHKILNVPGPYKDFIVTSLLVEKMDRKQLVYFWFQTKDKIARNIFENRFYLSLYALRRIDTYDMTIHVYTPLKEGESVFDAQRRLDDFVRKLELALIVFLKNNVKKVK